MTEINDRHWDTYDLGRQVLLEEIQGLIQRVYDGTADLEAVLDMIMEDRIDA